MVMAVPTNDDPRAGGREPTDPDPQVPERARRRQYSAAYKLKILAEYERLDRDGKGALLRREGLYTSLVSEWRRPSLFHRERSLRDGVPCEPAFHHISAPPDGNVMESWPRGLGGARRRTPAGMTDRDQAGME